MDVGKHRPRGGATSVPRGWPPAGSRYQWPLGALMPRVLSPARPQSFPPTSSQRFPTHKDDACTRWPNRAHFNRSLFLEFSESRVMYRRNLASSWASSSLNFVGTCNATLKISRSSHYCSPSREF